MVSLVSSGEEKKPAHALVVKSSENPSGAFCRIKFGQPWPSPPQGCFKVLGQRCQDKLGIRRSPRDPNEFRALAWSLAGLLSRGLAFESALLSPPQTSAA